MLASSTSLSKKLLSLFFVAALVLGVMPVAALAKEHMTVDGDIAHKMTDGLAVNKVDVGVDGVDGTPVAHNIVNEELPLDTVIAQTESTKSFFLAQALESTHTVPMVSAKLPIDRGTDEEDAGSGEDTEGSDPEEGVSAGSTVVGAFEQNGMTFAIEAEGESVALMAVDYAKLPVEYAERQVVVIPETVSPDGSDPYSVVRIANGAFSSLKKESADPAFAGCKVLFSDEELLAEAGMDPSEVEGFLPDDAAVTAQDDQEDAASSDAQAGADAREDGSGLSVEDDGSADPDSTKKVRTIVSIEGDIATFDDGSTYEFRNPLAGCTGILAAYIPASVSSIEDDAFKGFETLQYIVVSDDNSEYASYDGALYSADLTTLRLIPEGRVGAVRIAPNVTELDPEVFSHCPSVDVLVSDADSAAFTSVDGCLHSKDVSTKEVWLDVGFRLAFKRGISLDSTSASEQDMMVNDSSGVLYGESREQLETLDNSGVGVYPEGLLMGCSNGLQFDYPVPIPDATAYRIYDDHSIQFFGGENLRLFVKDTSKLVVGWVNTLQKRKAGGPVLSSGEYQVSEVGQALWPIVANMDQHVGVFPGTGSFQEAHEPGVPCADPRGYLFAWKIEVKANSEIDVYTDSNVVTVQQFDSSRPLAGWTTSPAKTVLMQPGYYGVTTAPLRVYAVWRSSAISFNSNGGMGGQTTEVTASFGSPMPAISSVPPSRPGYKFMGWYDSADYKAGAKMYYNEKGESTSNWDKGDNATLYAGWEIITYEITYDKTEGTIDAGPVTYTVETADFTLPTSGTRTGYAFAGWEVTGASGTGIAGNGTTNVTVKKGTYGNLTAKAKWTINTYHLSWNVSHGSHANRTSDFTVEDCPIAMTAATPDAGYTFQGWSGTGIAAGSKSFTITSAMLEGKGDGETFAYTGSFSANPYTAYLHANDGTGEGGLGETVAHAVTFDAEVPSASVPRRYGHVFSGYWTKNPDGTKGELYFDEDGTYVKGSVWKDASDVDLYACWTLMANLEVPVSAPGTVTLGIDRATVIGEDAAGTQAGPIMSGTLRSSVPQEVPVSSIELEALQDADGTLAATRILGVGNPEKCAVEVTSGPSAKALLSLYDPSGASMKWTPATGTSLMIPAATPVAAGSAGDDVTTDALGNLARVGELPLTYAMKLLPGFDVFSMPTTDATSEPVARIVFTVDLTGLVHERF